MSLPISLTLNAAAIIISLGSIQMGRANARRYAASERARAQAQRLLAPAVRSAAERSRSLGWLSTAVMYDACAEQCETFARDHDARAARYDRAARLGLAVRSR